MGCEIILYNTGCVNGRVLGGPKTRFGLFFLEAGGREGQEETEEGRDCRTKAGKSEGWTSERNQRSQL